MRPRHARSAPSSAAGPPSGRTLALSTLLASSLVAGGTAGWSLTAPPAPPAGGPTGSLDREAALLAAPAATPSPDGEPLEPTADEPGEAPATDVGAAHVAADRDDATLVDARRPAAVGAGRPASPPAGCTPAPLEQRAAAVLVVGLPHVARADAAIAREVMDLGVGGVFLSESNIGSAWQVRRLVDGLRERAGRPLLVSTDEESGRVAVTRRIVGAGPSPRRLAQRSTPDEVRRYAAGIGGKLADLGIDLDLAPLLDLDDGPWGGIIGDRSFSADPETAAEYGLAFSAGLEDAGVTPTVKHFPGHGRSTRDTHTEAAVVATSLAELRTTDLLPFQRAIDAGAPVIMLNHLGYDALNPELPASLSPAAYALLRDMGFEGVAITDSVGMGAVNLRWDFPEATVLAIDAGADAVLATNGYHAVRMRDALVQAVRSGRLSEERLSVAAARVTALAGGDPVAMSCVVVELPSLEVPLSAP